MSSSPLEIEKLSAKWQYDPQTLESFFEVVVRNWKEWQGPRPAALVGKLNGTFLQAVKGDYVDDSWKSGEAALRDQTPAYQEWKRLSGTPKETAKRRFITLLRGVSPKLLEIKLKPVGYRLTNRDGQQICPWCNTGRGCLLPLVDKKSGVPLTTLVENNIGLMKDPEYFRHWIKEHRLHCCALGVHMPVALPQIRTYLPWFQQLIIGGFRPYDHQKYEVLIRGVLDRQALKFQDLMEHPEEHQYSEAKAELDGLLNMIKVFKEYSGKDYTYEMDCKRKIFHCEQRRKNDRNFNHKHPIKLSLEHANFSMDSYKRVAKIREQCREVGVDVCTGVVQDLDQRFHILKDRLSNYERKQAIALESRERIEAGMYKKAVAKYLPSQSQELINKKLENAVSLGKMENILRAINLGGSPDRENEAGLTPLIRAVLLSSAKDAISLIKDMGAVVNYFNRHGMSALSWAAKRGDPVMIEVLMDHGADPALEGSNQYTPFMLAVEHGHRAAVEQILEHLFRSQLGSRGVDKCLNCQNKDGSTALMIAVEQRSMLMIRLLLRKNANRALKDNRGLTAEGVARRAGWSWIADFIATTRAVGAAGLYSSVDAEEERMLGEAVVRMCEAITNLPLLSPLPVKEGAGLKEDELPPVIKLIRSKRAGPNTETPDGSTPLICACFLGDQALIEMLVAEGASLDYSNRAGKSALMSAAAGGRVEVVKMLLQRGASLVQEDMEGRVASTYALEGGYKDLAFFLNQASWYGLDFAMKVETESKAKQVMDLIYIITDGLPDHKKPFLVRQHKQARDKPEARKIKLLHKYGLGQDMIEGDSQSWARRLAKQDVRMRCWLCTLHIPCSHFRSAEALKSSISIEQGWQWYLQPRGHQKNIRRRRLLDAQNKKALEGLLETNQTSSDKDLEPANESTLPEDQPWRVAYWNVRDLTRTEWMRPQVCGDIQASNFLERLGRAEADIVKMLSHGSSGSELEIIDQRDKMILTARSIKGSKKEPLYGFFTIDIRYSVCLYPDCTRCRIGFAKLRCTKTNLEMCDACVLLRPPDPCGEWNYTLVGCKRKEVIIEEANLNHKEELKLEASAQTSSKEITVIKREKHPPKRWSKEWGLEKLLKAPVPRRSEAREDHNIQNLDVYYRSKNLDLADYLIARGRAEQARGLLLKDLCEHLRIYGNRHVSIAYILRSLAASEEILGLHALSRAYRETSFEVFLCKFGPTHKDTTRGAALLVRSLLLQNAYADATSFYDRLSRALESTHLKHYRDLAKMITGWQKNSAVAEVKRES